VGNCDACLALSTSGVTPAGNTGNAKLWPSGQVDKCGVIATNRGDRSHIDGGREFVTPPAPSVEVGSLLAHMIESSYGADNPR
jgi:hypothetical protein